MPLRDTRKTINEETKRNDFLKKIENDYEKYGKHTMKKVKSKNIMIIGRARSGKTTIKSLLLDPTKVPDELTLKAGTKDPQIESFHIGDIDATLNIIDTPGLFERNSEEDLIRDNTTILNIIEKCANMEITTFNVICFCVSLTAGINGDDVASIELFMKFLGNEISKNSCLIITHCESKNEEQRNMIKKELREDVFFKQIEPFFKLGVFFSGSINRDNYNNGNECILDEYVTVCDYRTQLINLLTSDIKPFPITDSQISEIRRLNEAKTVILNELENVQNVCKQQDFTNADLQVRCEEQKSRIKNLQRECKEKKHTIDDLQRTCTEQKRITEDLQRTCTEQRRIIDDLQRKCTENMSYIRDLQNGAKEHQSIIQDLLCNSAPIKIFQLKLKYPNYFSNNNNAISRVDDNYAKYRTQNYK